MSMQNAPWEASKPTPPPSPQLPNQMQDIERIINMAEGLFDRVLPRLESFVRGVQKAQGGAPKSQFQDINSHGSTAPFEGPPAVVEGAFRPVVEASVADAEMVYGLVFEMLNLVPDETTCGDMRTFLRDNKDVVLGQLRQKLDG